MVKKRIYIAGPMRGYPDYNYLEFVRVADAFFKEPELCERWEVVSPVKIGNGFGSAEEINESPELLGRLMELELAVVKSCDAIFLMTGWEKSAGARAELRVALDADLEIYTQESGVLVR